MNKNNSIVAIYPSHTAAGHELVEKYPQHMHEIFDFQNQEKLRAKLMFFRRH
jgi:hypothetical protein